MSKEDPITLPLHAQTLIQNLLAAAQHSANVDNYIQQAVNLVQEALGYYHVQIYLNEKAPGATERLTLHSGTGAAGQERKQRGFSLPVNARRSLVAQAAREIAAVVINDTQHSPLYLPHDLLAETRAEMAIPLVEDNRLLGVLDVQHEMVDCFTTAVQGLLQVVAALISSALSHFAMQQQNARARSRLTVLHELTQVAATAVSENELITQATQLIGNLLQAENVGFRLVDPQSGNLRSHPSYQKRVGREHILRVTGPGEGVTGRVLATGQPWRIPDVSQEPAFLGNPAIRSELCVPLHLAEKVIGVINVESTRLNAFSAEDEIFLVTVASQLATAFQKIRLVDTFQQQIEEKDALLNTMKAISSLQVDDILHTLAREAKRLLQGDSCRIHLLDADEENLTCVIDLPDVAEAVRRFPIKLGQGITGSVALSGVPEIVPNTRFDRRAVYVPGVPPRDMAAVLVPLKLRQKDLGVMSVYRLDLNKPFSTADLNLLAAIAEQAAVAISNARLFAAEQRKREELSVLNELATVAAEAVSQDDLLSRATRFVGLRLYPDSFGVMLLDEVVGVLRTHHTYLGPEATVPVENSIAGLVATSGKPYLSHDVLREKRFFEAQFYELGAQMRAKLCVPLQVGGRIVGVLNAESQQPGAFSEADQRLLVTLSKQMATTLEKLQLLEAEQQRAVQQQALAAMSGTVLGALNLPDLWTAVSQAALKTLYANRHAVFLASADGSRLTCANARGLSETFIRNLEVRFTQSAEIQTLHNKQPLLASDAYNHPLTIPLADLIQQEDFHSYALFPLISNKGLLGVLGLFYDTPHQFVANDLTSAQTLAHIITVALQNAQLFSERTIALLNERKLNEFVRQIYEDQDLPAILANVVMRAANLIGADAGIVSLVLEGALMTYYPYNVPPHLTLEPSQRGRGLAWTIVDSGESLLLAHYRQHPSAIPGWVQAGVHAFLGVPLTTPEGICGALCLFNFSPHKPFSENDRLLAETIAQQAGLAIHNARRYDEVSQRLNQLAVALARQEELERSRDTFIQTMTHELRTPLGIVMGHAELLESGVMGALQPSQAESMHVITRRLQMISELLDDLALLLVAQTQELVTQPIQPQQLIGSLLADFQLQADELSLTVETDLPPDLPLISGEIVQLRRVFDNLLSNALKFTPAGGWIKIRAFSEGEYVIFCVADSGIGIPADQIERIFERFYQLRSHKSMNPYGFGLGLALVKELVAAHGGYVRVESEEGKGSTFEVALPVAR